MSANKYYYYSLTHSPWHFSAPPKQRAALRDFAGVDTADGFLYLRVLAKTLYDLTCRWGAKLLTKPLCDLKLLSCRIRSYTLQVSCPLVSH